MHRLSLSIFFTIALAACGSSATPEESVAQQQSLSVAGLTGQVLLGPVVGAEVNLFEVGATEPRCVTTTTSGSNYENSGRFEFPAECLVGAGPFIVVSRAGNDVDLNDDGTLDASPSPVRGNIHAVVTAGLAGSGVIRVSAVTEAAYHYVQLMLSKLLPEKELLLRLDQAAVLLLDGSISNTKNKPTFQDLLQWIPRDHRGLLKNPAAVATLEDAIRQGGDEFTASSVLVGAATASLLDQYISPGRIQAVAARGDVALSTPGDVGIVVEEDPNESGTSIFRTVRTKPSFEIIGSVKIMGPTTKALMLGGSAVLAQGRQGIQVVSASVNPPTVRWVGNLGDTVDIAEYKNMLVLANGTQGVAIAEWQTDGGLAKTSSITLPGNVAAMGLAVAGNKAYAATSSDGVYVLDLEDPTNLKVIGHFNAKLETRAIVVANNQLLDLVPGQANDTTTLNIRDLSATTDESTVSSTTTFMGRMTRIAVDGSIVYVSYGTYGVAMLDVGVSGAPRVLASYFPMDSVEDTVAIGDILLLGGRDNQGYPALEIFATVSELPP